MPKLLSSRYFSYLWSHLTEISLPCSVIKTSMSYITFYAVEDDPNRKKNLFSFVFWRSSWKSWRKSEYLWIKRLAWGRPLLASAIQTPSQPSSTGTPLLKPALKRFVTVFFCFFRIVLLVFGLSTVFDALFQVQAWARQHQQRLNLALKELLATQELLETLLNWLQWAEANISNKDMEILPQEIEEIKTLIAEHQVKSKHRKNCLKLQGVLWLF